jgi:hypothetical protein
MATINLGRIKPVWQGLWAASTAYVKDDIVRHDVDSYICTASHTSSADFASDSANWDLVAQGSTIPSQSGNAGKALLTDGTSLSWGDGGGVLQVKETRYTNLPGVSSSSYAIIDNNFSVTITPKAADSKFLLEAVVAMGQPHHDSGGGLSFFDSQVGTGTSDSNSLIPMSAGSTARTTSAFAGLSSMGSADNAENHVLEMVTISYLYTPSSQNTNSRTFYVAFKRNTDPQECWINHAQVNNGRSLTSNSLIRVTEIANGAAT